MIIVVLAIVIVSAVVAVHSYTRKDAPRQPFTFHINLDDKI